MANLRWLQPGLGMKRWVLLIIGGMLVLMCGSMSFGLGLFGALEQNDVWAISPYGVGLFLVCAGGGGVLWGVYRLARRIESLLKRHGDERGLTEIALDRSRQGAKIVCIGGGHGLNCLLTGLRDFSNRITAVVSVADDGGSSGRLRKEFGMLPPGDIRNCLSALANAGSTMGGLLQYRFTDGELAGHAFGNLFIMVLTKITGSFYQAVREANRLLNVRGQVLPVSLAQVTLVATHEDGTKTTGQKNISGCGKKIVDLALKPAPGKAPDDVIERILDADVIVLGPGSLYTSILPNLLMPDVVAAIAASRAKVFFVVNTTMQPGETPGFKVHDYIDTLFRHAPGLRVDAAIANSYRPSPAKLEPLAAAGRGFTEYDGSARANARVLLRDVMDLDDPERHDPAKLARVILEEWERDR